MRAPASGCSMVAPRWIPVGDTGRRTWTDRLITHLYLGAGGQQQRTCCPAGPGSLSRRRHRLVDGTPPLTSSVAAAPPPAPSPAPPPPPPWNAAPPAPPELAVPSVSGDAARPGTPPAPPLKHPPPAPPPPTGAHEPARAALAPRVARARADAGRSRRCRRISPDAPPPPPPPATISLGSLNLLPTAGQLGLVMEQVRRSDSPPPAATCVRATGAAADVNFGVQRRTGCDAEIGGHLSPCSAGTRRTWCGRWPPPRRRGRC